MTTEMNATETKKTPKEEMTELMVEVFGMIEELDVSEGKYLQFADLFKQMNLKVERLTKIKETLQVNYYYQHYIRPSTKRTLKTKRLDEEQKRKSERYCLCNCGRYISKDILKEHLQTQVHYQGRRNKKYASKGLSEEAIKELINREIALQAFIIKHLEKVNGWKPNDEDHDEVGI